MIDITQIYIPLYLSLASMSATQILGCQTLLVFNLLPLKRRRSLETRQLFIFKYFFPTANVCWPTEVFTSGTTSVVLELICSRTWISDR